MTDLGAIDIYRPDFTVSEVPALEALYWCIASNEMRDRHHEMAHLVSEEPSDTNILAMHRLQLLWETVPVLISEVPVPDSEWRNQIRLVAWYAYDDPPSLLTPKG